MHRDNFGRGGWSSRLTWHPPSPLRFSYWGKNYYNYFYDSLPTLPVLGGFWSIDFRGVMDFDKHEFVVFTVYQGLSHDTIWGEGHETIAPIPTCINDDHTSGASKVKLAHYHPAHWIGPPRKHIMQHGYFIVLVEILGFFHTACSGSGNNSENSSSSSRNTTILNNMLAREILQRQSLENKVATLERQITALISDVTNGQRACSALQRDVQGISLKQNNMASSLQTITQLVDSENVNMRESLRNLSDITSKLLSKGSQCKYNY